MKKENSKDKIQRLTAEVEMLRAENETLKKTISNFNEWYQEGKRLYAEKNYEGAIRHFKLGRGKHGRKALARDIVLDYLKAGIREDSKEKAIHFLKNKYQLASYASTVKYLRRALNELKKRPGNENLLKGLIPGNPTI